MHLLLPRPPGNANLRIETPLPLLAQLQIEQYARRTPLFSGAIDEQVFSCGQSGPA